MKQTLVLNYNLGDKMLQPYLAGLSQGRACARQCAHCGRTTFPPERRCRCQPPDDCDNPQWVHLSGKAHVIYRTDGSGGCFALVQFDGADNKATCRIANPSETGTGARLKLADEGAFGIMIELGGEDIEIDG